LPARVIYQPRRSVKVLIKPSENQYCNQRTGNWSFAEMSMMGKKGKNMNPKLERSSLEKDKIELIKMRIKNKYYDRDEVLLKVVQEIYERDLRKDSLN